MTKDINGQVGETAGKVWYQLSSGGPQTLSQLHKRLDGSSALLSFALGWLAREEKIFITPERTTFRIQLK